MKTNHVMVTISYVALIFISNAVYAGNPTREDVRLFFCKARQQQSFPMGDDCSPVMVEYDVITKLYENARRKILVNSGEAHDDVCCAQGDNFPSDRCYIETISKHVIFRITASNCNLKDAGKGTIVYDNVALMPKNYLIFLLRYSNRINCIDINNTEIILPDETITAPSLLMGFIFEQREELANLINQ